MIGRWLARIGSWINRRFRIIATDEESAVYDRIDRELREKGQ